jgi:hypothetical protein
VGVGSYRIDLHPSTGEDNYIDASSLPFQIPMGAWCRGGWRTLLPAAKNLGVTHITNGCESAAMIAAELRQLRKDAEVSAGFAGEDDGAGHRAGVAEGDSG